jgi:nucleoside-diphosphate-sugar epimerase
MNIAITGISGFLGGHLTNSLLEQGHRLTGLVRASSPVDQLRLQGVELRVVSFDRPPEIQNALRGVDVLIHAAAKIYGRGQGTDFASNPALTQRCLDAAIVAGVSHFIHLSTVGIYGFPRGRTAPFVESDGHGPIHRWNLYSRSKVAAENLVLAAQQTGRLQTTILRPTWIYGPGDTALMGRMIEVLRQQRFTWIGDGQNRISLIHVRDAVNAIVLAATRQEARGQAYNIAADDLAPTQQELVTRLCQLMELPLPGKRAPYRLAYSFGFLAECLAHLSGFRINPPVTRLSVLAIGGQRGFSSEKLRRELDWQPQVGFEEGIRQTTDWFHQQARRA